ncbi:uncharacterized protein [Pseudorasbora parva]|uniref:uncharacterized protein n=1 Tax=Pseudorasbora parva TaxID=51549 RepID=UPI00351EDA76
MFSKHHLLLLCFINYSGATPRSVTEKRGRDATLPCEFKARDISDLFLSRFSKNLLVCQNEDCKSKNDRVFKIGSCDVIINDLRLRDAGKYILRLHYTNDQRPRIREYQLHIKDEISVNTGEELKLDLLLINADKVETNSSGEWTEVWTRGHGVSSDRLTDSDGNLTINAFTSTDTGTYRVLDSEGQILITLTLTETGTGSMMTAERTTNGTEPHTAMVWILIGLSVLALLR